jgi:hypothetical protein
MYFWNGSRNSTDKQLLYLQELYRNPTNLFYTKSFHPIRGISKDQLEHSEIDESMVRDINDPQVQLLLDRINRELMNAKSLPKPIAVDILFHFLYDYYDMGEDHHLFHRVGQSDILKRTETFVAFPMMDPYWKSHYKNRRFFQKRWADLLLDIYKKSPHSEKILNILRYEINPILYHLCTVFLPSTSLPQKLFYSSYEYNCPGYPGYPEYHNPYHSYQSPFDGGARIIEQILQQRTFHESDFMTLFQKVKTPIDIFLLNDVVEDS